jgi:uncharacterized protein
MTDRERKMLAVVEKRLEKELNNPESGHDMFHAERVRKIAVIIAQREKVKCDMYLLELAALLHDVGDWKFFKGSKKDRGEKIKSILAPYSIEENRFKLLLAIIDSISFKGAGVRVAMETVEGRIVQDADRLDALGAIGIARCFGYSGSIGRALYNPNVKPIIHASFSAYKKNKGTAVNHFYEKLLLLKDRMNTKTGRAMAVKRHVFMEEYLKRFYKEWEGKDGTE